jgi:hypothetical protein
MSFTFKTEVLGVEMEVEGSFVPPSSEYGHGGYFEIEGLKHKGESLDMDGINPDVLCDIEEAAFKEAAKAAMQAEEDQAQELLGL